MAVHEELKAWLTRGNQRRAVVASLHGVMTGTQLWQAGRDHAPKLTLRDTRAILRQLEARGLVQCLNPSAPCGRLFVSTQDGQVAFDGLGADVPLRTLSLPADIEPSLVSYLLRGNVRHAVFRVVAKDDFSTQREWSASTIKRALRETCPVTLNQTSRALHDLRRTGLILPAQTDSRLRTYALTPPGVRLAQVMGYRHRNTASDR